MHGVVLPKMNMGSMFVVGGFGYENVRDDPQNWMIGLALFVKTMFGPYFALEALVEGLGLQDLQHFLTGTVWSNCENSSFVVSLLTSMASAHQEPGKIELNPTGS